MSFLLGPGLFILLLRSSSLYAWRFQMALQGSGSLDQATIDEKAPICSGPNSTSAQKRQTTPAPWGREGSYWGREKKRGGGVQA